MTSTQFADEIGVQRSSLSHILSGRNNPSLDFVTKILLRFPEIHSDWMLFGKGTMYETGDTKQLQQEEFDLFSNEMISEEPEFPKEKEDVIPKEIPIETNRELLKEVVNAKVESCVVTEKERRIDKIIILYSDATFEEFSPSKSKAN